MDEEKCGGSVVVVHDDGDVADLLTGLLRANGFHGEWCRSLATPCIGSRRRTQIWC